MKKRIKQFVLLLFVLLLTSCMYVKDVTVNVSVSNDPDRNGTLITQTYSVDGDSTKIPKTVDTCKLNSNQTKDMNNQNGTSQQRRRLAGPTITINIGNKTVMVPTDLTATVPASVLQ